MVSNKWAQCPNCNSTFTCESSLKVHRTFHCHNIKDDKSSEYDKDNGKHSDLSLHSSNEDETSSSSTNIYSSSSSAKKDVSTPKKVVFFYKCIGNVWHTCVGKNYKKSVSPISAPRGKPWHDWLKVKYHHDSPVHAGSSVVPSRLLMWMSIKPETAEHTVYCFTHVLQHSVTPKDRLLPDWHIDTYYKQAQVVILSNIIGPIYVLPGILHCHHNDMNKDSLKNEGYVIPPEYSKWHLHE
eukprot:2319350-Ditylum_brightwellii.AAC.1